MQFFSIPELVEKLVAMNGGSTEDAARQIGTTGASLSRWRSGDARPRKQLENRLRVVVNGGDRLAPVGLDENKSDRLRQLESAIARMLDALREEFHRTAAISTRQETLDLVAVLVFAHVTSIDDGGFGIGPRLRRRGETAAKSLNGFVQAALTRYLPRRVADADDKRLGTDRFFVPLTSSDEHFAERLLEIFEHDGGAFRALHEAGRDDLVNEVFSRFMSTSFVDEKEMGQYLTPPEITRFMVEVGFHALAADVRERLLAGGDEGVDLILDPSCGVGSFLAETIRFLHGQVRMRRGEETALAWLAPFVHDHVVGIDKSERMVRLAMINLGLFGVDVAALHLSNALGRSLYEGEFASKLEGKVQLILTNPPFGATYSGADVSNFFMGARRSKVDSELLFLERYVDWLTIGGVVVTVVPDSVLVNRGVFAELRAWLRERCALEAVFSLPPVTFAAAGTSTKTSVLVLRKGDARGPTGKTYFGEAREVGFDVVTRNSQRHRIRNARTDLPILLAEYKEQQEAAVGRWSVLPKVADRWDAGFHAGLPENIAAVIERAELGLLRVGDVATLVDERIDPRREAAKEFDYVEISDVDVRTALVGHRRLPSVEAPSRARKVVQSGDVLVSTVRPERGGIGLAPPDLKRAVCSTGLAVLRCSGIHPLALVWLLKTEFVRQQMIRHNVGIAYPAITEEACLSLVLPATREATAALSTAAKALAEIQNGFEQARRELSERVAVLDQIALNAQVGSSKIPNSIDGSEPDTVPDLT